MKVFLARKRNVVSDMGLEVMNMVMMESSCD